jgi:hypothetical protein
MNLNDRAREALRYGAQVPFDCEITGDPDEFKPPRVKDWAVRAARGVCAELQGRAGMKEIMGNIYPTQARDLVQVIAAIIREADRRRKKP